MTYPQNARATVYQRKRIRHGRAPYRFPAKALGIGMSATVDGKMRDLDLPPKN